MSATMQSETRRRSIPLDPSQLPRAVAAEAALIDAALNEAEARSFVLALPTGAITSPAFHPLIGLMKTMHAEGLPPDRISLIEAARATGAVDCDALWDTMQDIDGASLHTSDAEPHARVVRDRYEQRMVIQRVHAALELMVTTPADARATARRLVESMLDFAGDAVPGYVHAATALGEAYDDAQRRANGDTSAMIRTGLAEIDGDPVGGLEPGDLCTWVMVSGHGKTAAMTLVSLRAALAGTGVGFVSAEMTRKQIARRWASLLTGLPFARLKDWDLSTTQIARAVYAHRVIQGLPLYVDDQGTPTLAHVATQARRLVLKHPDVKVLVVDYITLVQGSAPSQVESYGQVIRSLKKLAKELGVAIIGLVQPDARTIERRGPEEQMPELADIAWSQEFRNQSDLIITGYRPGESVRQRTGQRTEDHSGRFCVRKSRNGGGGAWAWGWDGSTMAYDGGCWAQFDAMQGAA